jgi:hypothetical protein
MLLDDCEGLASVVTAQWCSGWLALGLKAAGAGIHMMLVVLWCLVAETAEDTAVNCNKF